MSIPAAMMMSAMIMVVVRSIFSRRAVNFFELAIFSLMTMRKPEIASIRLCAASEIMAREFEMRPMMMLKTASRKFVKIKRQPDFTITLLRFSFICLF